MSTSLTLANLRLLLGSISETLLSDDEGNFCLSMALKEINGRYGYAAADSTLLTVVDQQEYAVPDGVDVRKIREIIWQKSSVSTVLADIETDTVMAETAAQEGWSGVMETLLDDVRNAWRMSRTKGKYHIINQKIWLDPAPTVAGNTVMILHDADYASAAAIPAIYDLRFWWIAMAWALEILAIKDAGPLSVQDGSMTVRLDGGRAYRTHADKLRSRFSRTTG